MTLTPVDVKGLKIFTNVCEPRRDIHVFVNFIRDREVKRAHRTNMLARADFMRLAKLMTDPGAVDEVKSRGFSRWVEYIDRLALKLGFVTYNTEGVYMGYSSSERSFPDNYIEFKAEKYRGFLESHLEKQERRILNTLINDYDCSNNEFFERGVSGILKGFDTWGCATGVMPTLRFDKIREFLLDILSSRESGVWYSTASLIEHLKKSHRFFLIPKNFKGRYGEKERYGNFMEYKGEDIYDGRKIAISESDPDAFERVEGRYIERFLEGIPLTMGYVDTAYKENAASGLNPSINRLKAFRVRKRLLMLKKGPPEPKVLVQPDFEIVVESELYPAQILSRLTPIADIVKEDRVVILRLRKEKVAGELTRDENLDVISLLKELSDRELPQNIVAELAGWTRHSDMFTLFDGFALLEEAKELPVADGLTVERISPNIRIIRSPDELFARLENAELVPLLVDHSGSSFHTLPGEATTVFPNKSRAPKAKKKEKITLQRRTTIRYYFPSKDIFELFLKNLLNSRCHVEADRANLAITFPDGYSSCLEEVIKGLKKKYILRIEDIE